MGNEEREFNPELALTPGAPRAVDSGCTCPVIDNGRGRGTGQRGPRGEMLYWITEGCPLHGTGSVSEDAPDERKTR